MKKYIMFYKGPATPPNASHEKWPAWFAKTGDQLLDIGSPMQDGIVLHPNGATDGPATLFNGYSIVQAKDRKAVIRLVKDHPFLALGQDEYTVEIFELTK